MTVQAERPPTHAETSTGTGPSHRARSVAAAAAVLVAVGAAAAGLIGSFGHHDQRPPRPVLGQSLRPLSVYPVVVPQPSRPGAGQHLLPDLGRPGHATVLGRKPVIRLHIRYARVQPVMGHWQLELIAPEGATFNARNTQGTFYDVIINGRAAPLFFVVGDDNGINFAFGAGASWTNEADAVAVARSLTTSVSIAHCSPATIASNDCS